MIRHATAHAIMNRLYYHGAASDIAITRYWHQFIEVSVTVGKTTSLFRVRENEVEVLYAFRSEKDFSEEFHYDIGDPELFDKCIKAVGL